LLHLLLFALQRARGTKMAAQAVLAVLAAARLPEKRARTTLATGMFCRTYGRFAFCMARL